MISDREKYLFDVNGYLVIRNALSAKQVAGINDIIDRHGYDGRDRTRYGFYKTHLESHAELRELIDLPRIVAYLKAFMGVEENVPHFFAMHRRSLVRLDHIYFVFSEAGRGHELHLGNIPYVPPCSYNVRDRTIFCGLVGVAYVLNDVPPTQGGFACIPGSHKANFSCPREFVELKDLSHLVSPTVSPGDAIIFAEAVTHGALPWTAAHTRRVLFYKYSPAYMTWSQPYWSTAVLEKCTPAQRAMLEPPYVWDHPDFYEEDRMTKSPVE